jgi:hypothetical protein
MGGGESLLVFLSTLPGETRERKTYYDMEPIIQKH